jgi:hypothetical protein
MLVLDSAYTQLPDVMDTIAKRYSLIPEGLVKFLMH